MLTATEQYAHLATDPASSYRQLVVKGRRIAARTLYGLHVNVEEPRSIEQLAADYHLPPAAVAEAVAYCRSNPPEIHEDYREDEALMQASGVNDPDYRLHGKPRLLANRERSGLRRATRS